MAYFRRKFYYNENNMPDGLKPIYAGFDLLQSHPLFSQLAGTIAVRNAHLSNHSSLACVTKNGEISVNIHARLNAAEWAYVMAHHLLHLAFGHLDKNKMPSAAEIYPLVWNKACDIYVTRFLTDIGFSGSLFQDPSAFYPIKLNDERKIYEYLLDTEGISPKQTYGLNTSSTCDMFGTSSPIIYKKGEQNEYTETFAAAINHSIKKVVIHAGGHDASKKKDTVISNASEWFLSHYPLLGGLASSFKIIEDIDLCRRYEIHIAAVDAVHGEIYTNPSCCLTLEEWKFVLAHEYLHAGLCHHERCQGRDHYLWNIACDYVINDWLLAMHIGSMPVEDLLYDESLHNMSAEAIYDLIVKKCGNSKSMPLSEDTEKAICLAIRVPDLKAYTKASVWMNFSRTRCVKDLTITPPTAEAIYRPDLLKKSALFPCRLSPGKCSWADGLMSNSRLWKSIAPI